MSDRLALVVAIVTFVVVDRRRARRDETTIRTPGRSMRQSP
jgi:hypothetical protein